MEKFHGHESLLRNREFHCLLWARFLGLLNVAIFAACALPEDPARAVWAFGLPFILLAGFARRFITARTLRIVKALEVAIALAGGIALFVGERDLTLGVLFLFGVEMAFFLSADQSALVTSGGRDCLARANGFVWSASLLAIVGGVSFGAFLHRQIEHEPLAIALGLFTIAVAGFGVSRGIPAEATTGSAGSHKPWVIAGTSLVWFAIPFYLSLVTEAWSFTAGFMVGSIGAGVLSADFVEMGLVPWGFLLMGASAFGFSQHPAFSSAIAGVGSGVLVVILNVIPQMESKSAQTQAKAPAPPGSHQDFCRGRLMNNAANIAAAALAVLMLRTSFGRSTSLAADAAMIICSLYLFGRMRLAVVRFLLWSTVHLLFRLRIEGTENIPRTGPALLASNHVSYADAVLVGCLARWRTVHFLIWKPIFDVPVAKYFFHLLDAIPIDEKSPKNTVRALQAARKELSRGELAGIFPEGSITRTGEIDSFERGFEKLRGDEDVPVIPIRIEGLWGHPLSCKGGGPFRSWRRLWRPVVTVRAGNPIFGGISPAELREAVLRA